MVYYNPDWLLLALLVCWISTSGFVYYCNFITSRMNTHKVLSLLPLSHAPGFSYAITKYLVVCFLVHIITVYRIFEFFFICGMILNEKLEVKTCQPFFKLFVPCIFSGMKTNWCHYFIRILLDLYMFRAHRPIFRRVRTAVHTTIGLYS